MKNKTIALSKGEKLTIINNQSEFVSYTDACSYLKIDKSTLHRWIEAGKIDKHYLGKIPKIKMSDVLIILNK